jgi:hypothetical protein
VSLKTENLENWKPENLETEYIHCLTVYPRFIKVLNIQASLSKLSAYIVRSVYELFEQPTEQFWNFSTTVSFTSVHYTRINLESA